MPWSRKEHAKLLASLIAVAMFGAAAEAQEAPSALLVHLLVDPGRFDGQRVTLVGYCRLEMEATAIYLHKDDHAYQLGNTIWLEIDQDAITPELLKIGHCLVEGTFNAKNRGHFGMFGGALERITRYEKWPPHREKRRTGSKSK